MLAKSRYCYYCGGVVEPVQSLPAPVPAVDKNLEYTNLIKNCSFEKKKNSFTFLNVTPTSPTYLFFLSILCKNC